jgi:hypothetical protein
MVEKWQAKFLEEFNRFLARDVERAVDDIGPNPPQAGTRSPGGTNTSVRWVSSSIRT